MYFFNLSVINGYIDKYMLMMIDYCQYNTDNTGGIRAWRRY